MIILKTKNSDAIPRSLPRVKWDATHSWVGHPSNFSKNEGASFKTSIGTTKNVQS